MKRRSLLLWIVGLALFFYVEHRLGWSESRDALAGADFGWIMIAITGFILSQIIRIAKWKYFHRAARIHADWVSIAGFYFQIKLFGTLTPGRLGEFLPALASRRESRAPLLSFTTYDRLSEGFMTLLIAAIAFPLLLRDRLPAFAFGTILIALVLVVLAAVLLARNEWMMALARRLGGWLARFDSFPPVASVLRSRDEIAKGIESLQHSFRAMLLPGPVSIVLLITIAAVTADLLFWWATFQSVGIGLDLSTLVASVAVFNISAFFSPTPAGIGVADGLFVVFLQSVGQGGALGSFLLLMRLIHIVMTALPFFALRRGKGRLVSRES